MFCCCLVIDTVKLIFFFKFSFSYRFSSDDIAPLSESLISNLFRLVEQAETPEKLAENAYLMKCKKDAGGLLPF